MSERGKQLALLLSATLVLGGCAVAASPALTLGGAQQAAG